MLKKLTGVKSEVDRGEETRGGTCQELLDLGSQEAAVVGMRRGTAFQQFLEQTRFTAER